MALEGMWIDSSDNSVVTVDGSPEIVVTAITDKSVSGNDVSAVLPVLLANFDGRDAATSSPGYLSQDLDARLATFLSSAQLDTAQKKFGVSSLVCDGDTDGVSFPSDPDFNLGTGDFTVEGWFRPIDATNKNMIAWGGSVRGVVYLDVSAVLTLATSGVNRIVGGSMTTSPPTWNHVAVVRRGLVFEMFLNGVSVGTNAPASQNFDQALIAVGYNPGAAANSMWHGWIDDVRITKGTAIYTANFTPPERAHPMPPQSAFSSGSRLLQFDEISRADNAVIPSSLLLDFNGIDGLAGSPEYRSQDANSQLVTFLSDAQLDIAQFKFGQSSLLVAGTSDGVTVPDNEVYNFGRHDFTLEMWVRFNASPTANKMFIGQWNGSQLSWVWLIVSGLLRFDRSTNGTAQGTMVSNAWVPVSNQWYHIAIVRNGTQMQQLIDGVPQGAPSSTIGSGVLHNSTATVEIGWYTAGAFGHDGWIDDVRVTKGTARYAFNTPFVPNTAPHSDTVLRDMDGPDFSLVTVLGDNNRAVSELVIDWEVATGSPDGLTSYTTDDSVGRVLVFSGSAQLDTAQARFGEASLFTTTNSTVEVPSAADLAIGLQDFTIEFWIRGTTFTVTRIIFDNRNAANSAAFAIYASSGQLRYYVLGADRITGSTMVVDTWYHIIVTRKDFVTRMYLDGVQQGSDWVDTTNYIQNTIEIGGAAYTTGSNFDGWFDGIRMVVGLSLPPDEVVLGATGAASPLDETGWRITRPSLYTVKISIGDEATNFVTMDIPTNNDPVIVAMNYDSVAGYLEGYVNGIPSPAITYTGTPGFAHDFIMGEKSGDIYETVYVDRLLRSDDRQRVEGYFANKWGLGSSLPANHPFTAIAPDIVVGSELIANFDGASPATTYTAETGQVATFAANAQLDAAQSVFDSASLLLDGTGDYITFPQSTDFDFGSGDFTVECWARWSADPTTTPETFVSKWTSTASARSWSFGINNNLLRFSYSTNGVANGTFYDSTAAFDPVADQWYHVAASRRSGALRFFVDGVRIGDDVAASAAFFTANTTLYVGAIFETVVSQEFTGWIDSVRVTKGTALYVHSFDVPHRAFVAPVPAALLANFNGLDGIASPPGYTSEDAGLRPATFVGNAQLDTALKKFGGSALLLDGAGDYVTFPDSTDWDFGTGDYTLECWVRFNGDPGTAQMALLSHETPTTNRSWRVELLSNTLRVLVSTTGSNTIVATNPAWNPVGDQWYHVVVVRRSGTIKTFVDGVQLSSAADANNYFASASPMSVGALADGSFPLNGTIDGVRVVKGTALYWVGSPTTFTVPFDAPGEPIV